MRAYTSISGRSGKAESAAVEGPLDRLRRGKLTLEPLLQLALAGERCLRGAEIADEHDDERSEQGQRWKGAVEQQIRTREQREFEAKESSDDALQRDRPRVLALHHAAAR